MSGQRRIPAHDDLVQDLVALRDQGLGRIRQLALPALRQAAAQSDPDRAAPVTIETLLRRAVEYLGGGPTAEAAGYLFELIQGTRGQPSRDRRGLAADAFNGRAFETFRKSGEGEVIGEVADAILLLISEGSLRQARGQLERREPSESRLAVQWVRRFEAYYRIWTPAWGLGADLGATRNWIREPDGGAATTLRTGEPTEARIRRSASYALFRYAWFEWELRRFITRNGGLWLLSDTDLETTVADATYRVWWHGPYDVRAQSWLRRTIQAADAELDPFLTSIEAEPIGQGFYQDWLEWIDQCKCTWDGVETEAEYFPTWRHHLGITDVCPVHQVIEACGTYCDLIDRDWLRIADWYHIDSKPQRGLGGSELQNRFGGTSRHPPQGSGGAVDSPH